MRISPLDIRKQAFKKSLRGVDADEVRIFLELVASEYEKVLQENAMMAEKIRHQDERLTEFRELEKSMRNSLVTADRIASESRDVSEREAARVVQDAQLRAERILEDARERLHGLISEIETLKGKKEVYARRFWTLLEGQIGMLQEHLQDMGEVDTLRRRVEQLINQARPDFSVGIPGSPGGRSPGVRESDDDPDEEEYEPRRVSEELDGPVDRSSDRSSDRPVERPVARAAERLSERPVPSAGPSALDPQAGLAGPRAAAKPDDRESGRPRSLPRGLSRLLSRQTSLPRDEAQATEARAADPEESETDRFPIRQRAEGLFDLTAREKPREAEPRRVHESDPRS